MQCGDARRVMATFMTGAGARHCLGGGVLF